MIGIRPLRRGSSVLAVVALAVVVMTAACEEKNTYVARNASNLAAVSDQQKTMTEKLQSFAAELDQLKKDQIELTNQIKETAGKLDQVGVGQTEFQGEISTQISEINTQIGQISRSAGSSRTLRFDNVQDENTLNDFRQLIDRSTPKRGTFIVENKMESVQFVRVNGQDYYLSAGERRKFDVPVGNVSAQLRGQEIINWTIAAPKFEETIQIVPNRDPAPAPVTTSVTLPPVTYQSLPIYVEPVTYVSSLP